MVGRITNLPSRLRARTRALYDWWIDHRWADLVVTALVVGVYGFVVWKTGRFNLLSWLPPTDRRGLYSAFAVVVSLTGAMSGVAVAQLASAKGPRAMALKKTAGRELARSWRSIYVGAMTAALLAVLALTLDSTANPPTAGHSAVIAQWSFLVAIMLSVVKFARLTALFQPVITSSVKDDADADEPEEAPAPQLNVAAFDSAARKRANGS